MPLWRLDKTNKNTNPKLVSFIFFTLSRYFNREVNRVAVTSITSNDV